MGVTVNNLDGVINSLQGLPTKIANNLEDTINECADILYEELYKDCTLAEVDLKEMDYPYKTGTAPDMPEIHEVTGKLASSIQKIANVTGMVGTFSVFIDEGKVPYIKFIVDGTSKMVPRPIFTYVWNRVSSTVLEKIKAGLVIK